ncbi:putative Zinc finger, BED-type [Corchorus olitorius]|uniref:Zinc finger, BED-type n=1 Tax=Corchorus olitorius TaxID=93759 RepID=A0A1R3KTQ9_9ROSI|nr:putative Zinc finger, BED-type [Corchorus olitorius]
MVDVESEENGEEPVGNNSNTISNAAAAGDEGVNSNPKTVGPAKGKPATVSASNKRPRASKFVVWEYATKFEVDGEVKASCNYCDMNTFADSKKNGTSSLKNHVLSCPKNPLVQAAKEKDSKQKKIVISSQGELGNFGTLCVPLLAFINEALLDLFEDYRRACNPSSNKGSAPEMSFQANVGDGLDEDDSGDAMTQFIKHQKESGLQQQQKSELEIYLQEEKEKMQQGAPFDVLLWWRLNSPRFPALSCLARDLLAVPVSTVASESAFSTELHKVYLDTNIDN